MLPRKRKIKTEINLYGQTELANRLGVTVQAVNNWIRLPDTIPPKRCKRIEKLLGGRLTVKDLRPDLADIFGD